MKLKTISAVLLLATFAVPNTVLAEDRQMSINELYNLCSQFPLNSRCEGYTAPIPLSLRSGNKGVCAMVSSEEERWGGECKVQVTNETLTAYIEEGDRMELLDNEKATREIIIPLDRITHLTYQEGGAGLGKKIGLTLLLGWPGFLLADSEKNSTIEVSFMPQSDSDSPTQETPNTQMFAWEMNRSQGTYMRSKLEEVTGLSVEFISED
jgi:hypothetical protein